MPLLIIVNRKRLFYRDSQKEDLRNHVISHFFTFHGNLQVISRSGKQTVLQ